MNNTTISRTLTLPPGPKGNPLIGNLRTFADFGPQTFVDLRAEYGDIVYLRVGGRDFVFIAHPDMIKHVLQDNNRNYHKGFVYSKVAAFLGQGLLTSDGDFWRRQRRLAQPAFHQRHIDSFARTMVDCTQKMFDGWRVEPGQPFDLSALMMGVTLDIVSRTLFATAIDADDMATVQAILPWLLEETDRRANDLLGLRERLPLPVSRRYTRDIEQLDAIIGRIINHRRAQAKTNSGEEAGASDLLAMLMEAQDEETGERMSDAHLRDEVMTIILAGHETTANLLTWTHRLLSEQPAVRTRLQDEVDRVLAGRPPALSDLPQLPYARRVLDEALRLYPPAWGISRTALEDDTIGGYRVPTGADVFLCQYVTHRHPDFWENPLGFDPDRFLPERSIDRPRYAYWPFGGGPRLCIGNSFALMEATIILCMITQRFELDLVPNHTIEIDPSITLRPRNGVLMTRRAR